MPVALLDTPLAPSPQPPRRRWTRAECAAVEALGIWDQEQLELIEGDLIKKVSKNRPHINALVPLWLWLNDVFGRLFVNPETPIDVAPEDNPTNEPQPDLIVLKRPTSEFLKPPQPADLHLVIEVSDSSLQFDLSTKAALYARAGIPEYWVLDLNGRRMIVHREPSATGYRSINAYAENESVTPLSAPDSSLVVANVLQ
jgi:Uma2 family endonuclease